MVKAWIFPGVVVAAVGCAGDAANRLDIVRTDSAGIEIITNLSAAPDTFILTEPELRLGAVGLDDAPEFTFELISDIAVLSDMRIVVVDNRGARVAIYTSDGTWLRDLAGRGSGPGEYEAPIRVSLVGDTIYLWDTSLRRLSRYASSGEYQGSVQIADKLFGLPFVLLPDGILDENEWGQGPSPEPAMAALLRRDRTGTVVDTLVGPYAVPEIGWRVVDSDRGTGAMVNPPALLARPGWALVAGSIVHAAMTSPQLEIHTSMDGALERVVRLPRDAGVPTAADREAYIGAFVNRFGLTPDERAALEAETVYAEHRSSMSSVLGDEHGQIWVSEFDATQPFRAYTGSGWDVIDESGRLVTHIRFPSNFHLKQLTSGRAYGIETTADDVHVVTVFNLSGVARR